MKRSTILASILVTGLMGTFAFAETEAADDIVQPLTCEEIISAVEESATGENVGNFIVALEAFAEHQCHPQQLIEASPEPDASRYQLCINIMSDAESMPGMLERGTINQDEFDEAAAAYQASASALQCGNVFLDD